MNWNKYHFKNVTHHFIFIHNIVLNTCDLLLCSSKWLCKFILCAWIKYMYHTNIIMFIKTKSAFVFCFTRIVHWTWKYQLLYLYHTIIMCSVREKKNDYCSTRCRVQMMSPSKDLRSSHLSSLFSRYLLAFTTVRVVWGLK